MPGARGETCGFGHLDAVFDASSSPPRSAAVAHRIPAQGEHVAQPGQERQISRRRRRCVGPLPSLVLIRGPPPAADPAVLQQPPVLVGPSAAQPGRQGREWTPSFSSGASTRLLLCQFLQRISASQVSNPCGGSPQFTRPPAFYPQQLSLSVDGRRGTSSSPSPSRARSIQVGFGCD